jgi:DNA-binding MarR family transcriptional regulator
MTSQVVRSLERKDLVEREINPADSRARRLKVTRRGARLAPRAIDVVQEIDAAFFREIPLVEGLGLLRQLARFPVTAATGEDEALRTVEA